MLNICTSLRLEERFAWGGGGGIGKHQHSQQRLQTVENAGEGVEKILESQRVLIPRLPLQSFSWVMQETWLQLGRGRQAGIPLPPVTTGHSKNGKGGMEKNTLCHA